MSRWPDGPCNAVAVQGSIVFFDRGASLQIGDFTDPTAPEILGGVLLPAGFEAIALQGRYAYVAGADAALRIIDVINLAQPVEVGSLGPASDYPHDVAVSGSYAYVTCSQDGLRVIDISVPTAPVQVGSWMPPVVACGIQVRGHYAYVACGSEGLRILDVSNPSAPVEVGAFSTGFQCVSLDVVGNVAYLPMGYLVTVDVSVPSAPVEIGRYELLIHATHLTVAGLYAYVQTYDGGLQDLRVFDVSDPAHLLDIGGVDDIYGVAKPVVVGSRVYAAAGLGFEIVDITYPSLPERLSRFRTGCPWAVAVAEGKAYVANAGRGLSTIDLQNPAEPREVSCFPLDLPHDVASKDHYAFVADNTDGLRVLDVGNPASPVEVGNQPGIFGYLELAGDCLLAGIQGGGVQTFDVTNPANPSYRGSVGDGAVYGLAARNGFYWATMDNSGGWLWMFDGCSVDNAWMIPIVSVNGYLTRALGIAGDYAYVGTSESDEGLTIVDISDPENLHVAGFYSMTRAPEVIAIDGNTMFAARGPTGRGIRVLDIADPLLPVEVEVIDGPPSPREISYRDGYLFVADNETGLWVFRDEGASGLEAASGRPRFRLLGTYPNPSTSATTIRYELDTATVVDLGVFDPSGHLVQGLKSGVWEGPGPRQAIWDGRDEQGRPIAAGTYFYKLRAGGRVGSGRVTLLR
jgi:hypothetical protein